MQVAIRLQELAATCALEKEAISPQQIFSRMGTKNPPFYKISPWVTTTSVIDDVT